MAIASSGAGNTRGFVMILPKAFVRELKDMMEKQRSGSVTVNLKDGKIMTSTWTGSEPVSK